MSQSRYKRSERIAAMTSILTNHPNRQFGLGTFSQQLDALKSALSEDLGVVKRTLESLEIGEIHSATGAGGGIRLIPRMPREAQRLFLKQLTEELIKPERILTGGYLYYTDLISSPDMVQSMAEMLAQHLDFKEADMVVTVETKGVPLAFMTARLVNRPLVIVRRTSRVTEGSTISVNYRSGSTGTIQQMVLSRRAIPAGSRVVMIDDFMRGGGTARGMHDLMKEFDARVVGSGVLMATREPRQKRSGPCTPLLYLESVNEETGEVLISPNEAIWKE
ncbi:pur operon repressor [Anoxynatronum buryatiense]|uniref:Purine operon repressor, PurR n=1 Tax=Anoxynatronum buryatiense TaxID=489973 RepID=A0AA45WVD0_9CLOT|nr:pur operon repressor [Anoxynatronum buryatiense]SMP51459.1 purine operon repressor, PurR [Anoxynatronum buryatiense]